MTTESVGLSLFFFIIIIINNIIKFIMTGDFFWLKLRENMKSGSFKEEVFAL